MLREDEHTEFKEALTDDAYNAVVALANTDGGELYIGIRDDAAVVGIAPSMLDRTYTALTNGIRDRIRPDVTMFTKTEIRADNVIKVSVGKGTAQPYYLQGKGIKPSGVYVRQGASSVQASFEKNSSND